MRSDHTRVTGPVDGVRMKRDDEWIVAGAPGAKARACYAIALAAPTAGLITAGSRHSAQVHVVALIARHLGIPARVHVPAGPDTPELVGARKAGARMIAHRPGYNTVIVARARADADAHPYWTHIPFGMECRAAVDVMAREARTLPDDIERIVVPVGGGMSLAGILHGLAGRTTPVLGVTVGADPTRRLDQYAPGDWRNRVTLIPAGVPYGRAVPTAYHGVLLDPHYAAKCVPFLRPGDLLWVVGIRPSLVARSWAA